MSLMNVKTVMLTEVLKHLIESSDSAEDEGDELLLLTMLNENYLIMLNENRLHARNKNFVKHVVIYK